MCGAAFLASSAPAQQYQWQLEGALPHYALPHEHLNYLARGGVPGAADAPTPAPIGPLRSVAEYEPTEGLQFSYRGAAQWNAILVDMAVRVTTGEHGKIFMAYQANVSPLATIQAALTSAGANMSLIEFIPATLDGIWCRDYGPRHAYQGGNVRVVLDHRYNRPRENDNLLPWVFATAKNRAIYEAQLNHGGGNYHLDALSRGFATRLVSQENIAPVTTVCSPFNAQPWVTWVYNDAQIRGVWQNYWNVGTTLFDRFPCAVDLTGHIDMWMQIVGDSRVLVSDWPNNPGSVQDVICDNAAVTMAGLGYTVYRVPAFSISGVHYTFTNLVMVNNLVMVPSYTQATVAPFNASALATIQTALDGSGKVAQSIPCQNIITAAGAVHCIVMHVPKFIGPPGGFGGLAPTAYLTSPQGGETLTPGGTVDITWVSDDDESVQNVDLRLSVDGGATFPYVIASQTPNDRVQPWIVPNIGTTTARVRVVARDAAGNTGADDSDTNFTIDGGCYADCNTSGTLTVGDFGCFQGKYVLGDAYADCNHDGSFTVADFGCFQNSYVTGCP
ncbi:MAG: agmatine deiminase family protein [Phycisphaerales bacterium]